MSRGADRRRDGGVQDKFAKAAVILGGRGQDVVAKDVSTAKCAAVGRSQQSSRSISTHEVSQIVAVSYKGIRIERQVSVDRQVQDNTTVTGHGLDDSRRRRRSDTASSRSSALKPDLAQRQSGLMLIAPVNTDTVMRSVQDVVHARARHHSSRHVSHCAAELKIGGLGRFPPCGNGTVNENGTK